MQFFCTFAVTYIGAYPHGYVAFITDLFIAFLLISSNVKIWRFYDCEGISSRMPIACSVGLTYSYNQGHAKYLTLARKVKFSLFLYPTYSPLVLGGTDAGERAEPSSLELCRATRKSPKAMLGSGRGLK